MAASALVCCLALPAAAQAHSLVRPADGLVSYLSQDATSLNTLTVSASGGGITFKDPTVDGGMDPGGCAPGAVSAEEGYILEASCPARGVRRLRIDLGEREDVARITAAIPATVLGGPGADRITGGPAADQLAGDAGDDVLAGGDGADVVDGGLGADRLDGGPGDDELRVRDGIADEITCGAGTDAVVADTLDVVAAGCERVDRLAIAPPPGAQELGADRVPPQLRATSARTQRISASRRTVRVVAATSEAGAVATSGVLRVGDEPLPVAALRRTVAVGGGGVELRVVLTRAQHRAALRALGRDRRVTLALSVVATDRAGNSRQVRLGRVRLVL